MEFGVAVDYYLVGIFAAHPWTCRSSFHIHATHHSMDTPLMNKSSFGSYVNVRKTFNFKRFPNPEVLNVSVQICSLPKELKDDVRSLVSVEREGDVLKRIVLASYPGVTEHEVHKSVQHW